MVKVKKNRYLRAKTSVSALVPKSGFIPYVGVYSKGFNFDSIDHVSFSRTKL